MIFKMAAAKPHSASSCREKGLVRINISGESMVTVLPSLFKVAGESKLCAIGEDCWGEPLDVDGNIFVDYSPVVFMPLIEWLRELRDAEPGQEVPAKLPYECRTAFIRMMKAMAFPLRSFRVAGIQVQELHKMGCSAQCLHTEGAYSIEELILSGFKASDIRCLLQPEELAAILSNWSNFTRLLEQGFSKTELENAGLKEPETPPVSGGFWWCGHLRILEASVTLSSRRPLPNKAKPQASGTSSGLRSMPLPK